ncbi:hypothetical protein [Nocardia sp. NPDC004604]
MHPASVGPALNIRTWGDRNSAVHAEAFIARHYVRVEGSLENSPR